MGKDPAPRDRNGRSLTPLNMPAMTCYTLRHFIATNMRRADIAVSREQGSKWLGDVVSEGLRTTDWYEKFDPDYLEDPMRATERIIQKLQNHTHKSLTAPTMPHKAQYVWNQDQRNNNDFKRKMVGVERFELPTLWSQTRCATRLRYTPTMRLRYTFRGPTATPNIR